MISTDSALNTQVELARRELTATAQDEPRWLRALRRDALSCFEREGYPDRRHEEWRYTDLRAIAEQPLATAPPESAASCVLPATLCEDTPLLTLRNGRCTPADSRAAAISGVELIGLANAIADGDAGIEEVLSRSQRLGPVDHLNAAIFQDGARVHIAPGVQVGPPLEIVSVSAAETPARASHMRTVISVGAGARGKVVITNAGHASAGPHLLSGAIDVELEQGAQLELVRLARDSGSTLRFDTLQVRQQAGSRFRDVIVGGSGELLRNQIRVELLGEGAHCDLLGLALVDGERRVDHHTLIEHAVPNCTSDERYRSILWQRGTCSFSGRIHVHPDAQHTDAFQSSAALLLSEEATANSRPCLEIYADDVRCTHGATVGQLDENSLFYLRSRGIPLAAARNLLTHAFAEAALAAIEDEAVVRHLEQLIDGRLPREESIS